MSTPCAHCAHYCSVKIALGISLMVGLALPILELGTTTCCLSLTTCCLSLLLASSRWHLHTPQTADVSVTWPSESVAALTVRRAPQTSPHNFAAECVIYLAYTKHVAVYICYIPGIYLYTPEIYLVYFYYMASIRQFCELHVNTKGSV
jgi:hypothetical protein